LLSYTGVRRTLNPPQILGTLTKTNEKISCRYVQIPCCAGCTDYIIAQPPI